jgi:hypothetical protein
MPRVERAPGEKRLEGLKKENRGGRCLRKAIMIQREYCRKWAVLAGHTTTEHTDWFHSQLLPDSDSKDDLLPARNGIKTWECSFQSTSEIEIALD